MSFFNRNGYILHKFRFTHSVKLFYLTECEIMVMVMVLITFTLPNLFEYHYGAKGPKLRSGPVSLECLIKYL